MPATSRSGDCFWRRSNSGRAGSPSKSMITQPVPPAVCSVCPRWKSPWVRIARPPSTSWERMVICSRTSCPRPAIAATRSSSGRRTKIRSMSSSIVAVSSDSDSELGSSGLKAGSPASLASTLCSSAVTVPSLPRSSSSPSGSVTIRSSAISQPPVASGKKRCATPSVAENDRPSYWYQPSSGAMLA